MLVNSVLEAESELVANVCCSCGALRDLPFDLGTDFHCADAAFECSERLQENVCSHCGAVKLCPFRLEDFLCAGCGGTAPKRRTIVDVLHEKASMESM